MWLLLPAECSNERLLQQMKHPQERIFRLTGAKLVCFRGSVRKPYVNPTMIFISIFSILPYLAGLFSNSQAFRQQSYRLLPPWALSSHES